MGNVAAEKQLWSSVFFYGTAMIHNKRNIVYNL